MWQGLACCSSLSWLPTSSDSHRKAIQSRVKNKPWVHLPRLWHFESIPKVTTFNRKEGGKHLRSPQLGKKGGRGTGAAGFAEGFQSVELVDLTHRSAGLLAQREWNLRKSGVWAWMFAKTISKALKGHLRLWRKMPRGKWEARYDQWHTEQHFIFKWKQEGRCRLQAWQRRVWATRELNLNVNVRKKICLQIHFPHLVGLRETKVFHSCWEDSAQWVHCMSYMRGSPRQWVCLGFRSSNPLECPRWPDRKHRKAQESPSFLQSHRGITGVEEELPRQETGGSWPWSGKEMIRQWHLESSRRTDLMNDL